MMILCPLVVFKLFLFMSVLLALSSGSCLMMWVALEMNMLSFLPVLVSSEASPLENSMKYFLIQGVASILFIMSALTVSFSYTCLMESLMIIPLLMKLGAVPLQGWFLSLVKTVNIYTLFLLSTVQKIIPLTILSVLTHWAGLILPVCTLSFLFIFFSGLALLSFFKILALSSINNLVWLLVGMFSGFQYLALYFFIYTWLFMGVYLIFAESGKKVFHSIQMAPGMNKLYISFILMSAAGLPPMVGFMGKVCVLKASLLLMSMFFIIFLLLSSLVIMFLYLSFAYLAVSFSPCVGATPKKNFFTFKDGAYMVSVVMIWPAMLI